MTFDVSSAREDLPSARAAAYLNAGTFGPLPRAADAAMRAHLGESFERGRIGTAGLARWFGQMDVLREAFARSLGASPDEVALMHCTTDGCNVALWGLPLERGEEIVTTTHEHPGLTAPLDELARVRGVVVRVVAPTAEAIIAATSDRTRLVALSHVLWTTGETLDVAEIARAAHAKGAIVLVDGAQSIGAIPVDPGALGADLYTVSGQKWLCGPSGTGALWVRPSVLDRLGTPWPWYLSRSRGPAGVTDWKTARRLDATTLSMTSMAGAIAALAWHQEQVSRGALDHAAAQARALRDALARAPGVTVAEATRPSLLVSFSVRDVPAPEVTARLERDGVLVRSIPSVEGTAWVRASAGFWTDEGDVARLVDAVSAISAAPAAAAR